MVFLENAGGLFCRARPSVLGLLIIPQVSWNATINAKPEAWASKIMTLIVCRHGQQEYGFHT
jgi:hypothetical protein